MAYTQSDVAKLKRAMSSGVRSITYSDGKRVEYRDLAEMERQLARMEREVAGGNGGLDISYPTFSRGF